MLQAATPYSNDEDIEGALDMWVEQILKKYPTPKPEWIYKPEPKAAPMTPEQLESIKQQLKAKGVMESSIKLMSQEEILKMAATQGIKPSEGIK